jgi:hypothetical protein
MMKIKVNNGTTPSNLDLCKNCVHARIRKHSNNREVRQCTVSNEQSQWANVDGYPVVECSSYMAHVDAKLTSYQAWDMIKGPDGQITFRDPLVPVPSPFASLAGFMRVGPPPSDDNSGGGVH